MSRLTHAPLPTWTQIVKAIFNKRSKLSDLSKYWSIDKDASYWFSRSAWSLYAISKFRMISQSKDKVNVWMPDYFCNESIEQIRTLNVEVFFYPVSLEGMPNIAECSEAMSISIPDIILFVHYFGAPTYSEGLCELAKKYNAWLVEDAAHCLAPENGIGKHGDFVLYSPHKTLAVPDGGLLLIRENGPNNISKHFLIEHGFDELYFAIIRNGKLLNIAPYKWLLKRILQKIGVSYNYSVSGFYDHPVKQNKKDFQSPKMSRLAIILLSIVALDLRKESNNRKNNQNAWNSILDAVSTITLSKPKINYTPYLSIFVGGDSTSVKNEFNRLQRAKLPVSTWPDLPPEVVSNSKNHENAIIMRKTRLFFPVHSSLNPEKIKENMKGFIN
jgi:hypothetical protein